MDKTVITPMSPVGKEAQTPSELESLREKFSPEELLSQLQKRIEVARNEKERREFSDLAEKLRAELSRKSEALADQTSDAISNFRSGLSTEQEILERLLRDVDTWLTPMEAVELGLADLVQPDRNSPRMRVVGASHG